MKFDDEYWYIEVIFMELYRNTIKMILPKKIYKFYGCTKSRFTVP